MFYLPDLTQQDWTDAFNPELTMNTLAWRNRSVWEALNEPTMQAIRMSMEYEPRLQIIPDRSSNVVAPRALFEESFAVTPGSFLIGCSGKSDQPEGFDVQIRDLSNNTTLFSAPINHSLITNGPATDRISPMCLLPKPRVFPNGFINVQVSNAASVDNKIALVLWFLQPRNTPQLTSTAKGQTLHGLGDAPTTADLLLQQEVLGAQLALRGRASADATTTSSTTAQAPQLYNTDPRVMPLDGRPFFYLTTTNAPPAGSGDFTVLQFRVPAANTAYLKEIQHFYEGPGFLNGSNDLIWRIAVDGTFSPGFDAINSAVGINGFHELAGPIIARSGQLVQYVVNVAPGTALGGKVTCGMQGYFAPEL